MWLVLKRPRRSTLSLHRSPYSHLVHIFFIHALRLLVRHRIEAQRLFCTMAPMRSMLIWTQLDPAVLVSSTPNRSRRVARGGADSRNLIRVVMAAGFEAVRIAVQVFFPARKLEDDQE